MKIWLTSLKRRYSLPLFLQIGPLFRSKVNRRNFWLGLGNGVFAAGGEAFTDPSVVLTYFTSLLTSSKFLVGLVAPVRIGGWFLPQLLVSGFMQRQERKLQIYTSLALFRAISWGLMVPILWFVQDRMTLLALFFALLVVNSLGAGIAGLSFMDVVGKVIPPHRRGAFFSARRLLGGVLALAASGMVGWVLSAGFGLAFPHNIALLFALSFVGTAVALFLFTRVDEPLEPVSHERVSVSSQIRRARHLPGQNHTYGRFLGARLFMVIADMAVPFYVVFARESLSAPPGLVGVYLSTRTLSELLTNLWAGRVSDRYGSRRLLLVACLIGLAAPGLALVFDRLRGPAVIFAVVFALSGAYNTSAWIAHTSFLLDIAPASDRPIYVGTANTLIGTAILASSGGGALVDWLGFEVLFGLALVALLVAAGITASIQDPRKEPTPQVALR